VNALKFIGRILLIAAMFPVARRLWDASTSLVDAVQHRPDDFSSAAGQFAVLLLALSVLIWLFGLLGKKAA
jgi:hypothetical protein